MPIDCKAALYFVLSVYIIHSSTCGSVKPGVIADRNLVRALRDQREGKKRHEYSEFGQLQKQTRLFFFLMKRLKDCVALLSRNSKMKVEKKLFLQTLVDVGCHKALKLCYLETFLTYCCFCLWIKTIPLAQEKQILGSECFTTLS